MEELKYKKNRKLSEFTCAQCGCTATKPTSEITRNEKLGRNNYCSRSCVGRATGSAKGQPQNLIHTGSKKDEFSPFRYYIKCAKQRFKEFSLTLQDLKDVWENQNGVCPYSGLPLILSQHDNILSDPFYSASLDRIDSSKGYIKGNIQFVSLSVNYMKGQMTHEQTVELCKLIAQNYQQVNVTC